MANGQTNRFDGFPPKMLRQIQFEIRLEVQLGSLMGNYNYRKFTSISWDRIPTTVVTPFYGSKLDVPTSGCLIYTVYTTT